MINTDKLKQVLTQYKADFPSWWKEEEYKWIAVKWFQDHWNIEAEDFGAMFKEATKKTKNLLNSGHAYPGGMICKFAQADVEATREMFRALFDESEDNLSERVKAFQETAKAFWTAHNNGTWKNHFQDTSAISVYLWLHAPDMYFIYRYQLVKTVAAELGSKYKPKKGSLESMIGGYKLYNEIREAIKADVSVCKMIQNAVTQNSACYPDPEFGTAAIDVAYYLAKHYSEMQTQVDSDSATGSGWLYPDYSPNLSTQEWAEMLKDSAVFDKNSLQIMARMKDYGGEATCKQLSEKYGEAPNFYNAGSSALAKRVWEKTQCPLWQDEDGNQKWWPILYLGKNADSDTDGCFVWRLRDELREALNQVSLPPVGQFAGQTQTAVSYSEDDFLMDVYLGREQYDDLKNLLENKKNVILQGAPGVGKTFAAKRLAYSIMGKTDNSKIEFVQFHQNTSYEDFVQGYRPDGESFVLKYGIFYRFCRKATNDPENRYFFLIDEINRGNLSKIFGELLMLIENDKRMKFRTDGNGEDSGLEEYSAAMAYTGERFSVPENVYIIGMMNTADRSLAMIDYALRRRFSFFEMKPAFDSDGFKAKKNSFNNTVFDNLIEKIKELNVIIEKNLGSGFQIGHSYFCEKPEGISLEKWMEQIVKYDIIPLLEEYWFDEPEKTAEWKDKLLNAIKPVSGETQTATSQEAPSGDNTVQNPGQ